MEKKSRNHVRNPLFVVLSILLVTFLLAGCPNASGFGPGPTTPDPDPPLPADFVLVYDGSEIPLTGFTLAMGSAVMGTSIGPLSFSITNSGGSDLVLTSTPWATVTGDTTHFSIGGSPSTTVAAGQTEIFTLTYTPSGIGAHSVTITIAHNAPNDPPVVFVINASATAVPEPEIAVFEDITLLADGSGSFDFGDQRVGSSTSATFSIDNLGTALLTLTGGPLVAIGGTGASAYSVTTPPASTIAAGGSSDFVVQFSPSSAVVYAATITIENDDSDEGTYTFDLTGTGTVPEIAIAQGATNLADGSGTHGFGPLTIGDLGTPVDFTIGNTGTAELLLTGSPDLVALSGTDASEFSVTSQPASTVGAGGNDIFSIRFEPTSGGAKTATVTVDNDDPDEGTYTFTITGTGLTPDISISQNATTILHGSGSFDFGVIHNGDTKIRTFHVNNDGISGSFLRLPTPISVSVSGADPVSFTVVQPVSADIPATGTNYTTFTIEFEPGNSTVSIGSFTAIISVASNDPDTDPYTFTVSGETYYQTYTTHGTSGTGAGQFEAPVDVVYNPVNSKVYVLDRLGAKVLVFDEAGGPSESEFGPTGTANGNMSSPESIDVDSIGNVYVASTGYKPSNPGFYYIQKFDKDGVWLTGWGANGTGDGDFQYTARLAVGPGDEIFVTDPSIGRVQVFNSSGVYQRQWAVTEPYGIAVFPGGLVLVTSIGSTYVQEYTSDGVFQGDFGSAYGFDSSYISIESTMGEVFIDSPGVSPSDGVRIYNDTGNYLGILTTAEYGIAKIFANVRGMSYGGGNLYFVNEDVGNSSFYGNDLLIIVGRVP